MYDGVWFIFLNIHSASFYVSEEIMVLLFRKDTIWFSHVTLNIKAIHNNRFHNISSDLINMLNGIYVQHKLHCYKKNVKYLDMNKSIIRTET